MKNKSRRIYYALATLVVILLIVSAILRALTPPQIVVPANTVFTQNFDGSQTKFGDIAFTGSLPSFPTKLAVGQAKATQASEQYVVSQLVSTYQLKKLDVPPNTWVGDAYSLNKDQQTGNYYLAKNQVTTQTAFVNQPQAVAAAAALLQKTFPDISLKSFESQSQFFTANVEPKTVDPSQAQIVLIPFAYLLNNLPVFYQNQSAFPFEIYITADNQVQKLIFNPNFIQVSPIQDQAIISVPQAITNMKSGNVSVISSIRDVISPGDFSQISSANMTSVQLEYRVDATNQLIYPFYHFSGTGKNLQNEDLKLELITPAIQSAPKQAP